MIMTFCRIVLAITTFEPKDSDAFRYSIHCYVQGLIKSGHKKIAISLLENGGGFIEWEM